MSSAEQTITKLRELKLTSMAQAYDLQLRQPGRSELSFEDRFGLLVEFEAAERESRKLNRLVKAAGLPEPAALEDVDHRAGRELDKAQLAALSSCDWVRRQQNLIIHGATGVGKTWLACAFATQACRLKMPVLFYRASDLYGEIAVAALDGSLPRLKLALARPSLLVLDDFGIGEITTGVAQVLLDVVERRMRTGSLLLTSQYPTDQWHGFFPDPTVADAVLDRVVHQSHRLTLKGESMRKRRAQERMRAR